MIRDRDVARRMGYRRRMPVLRCHQLHVTYEGGVDALVDVSLAVESGETVAMVGESGSGKTTLLKCFNRLVTPTRGVVEVHGEPVGTVAPERLRRGIGYVQQEGGLLPHWSVRENVELVPKLLGWDRERRRERSDALLDLVGLDPVRFGDRRPGELSGGQRQRVAFARALAGEADVLLLDEPFGALDPVLRAELQDEVARWQDELHKTVLLVTHDMAEAMRLGDRVVVLREGRVQQTAPPETLRDEPANDYVRALLRASGPGRAS